VALVAVVDQGLQPFMVLEVLGLLVKETLEDLVFLMTQFIEMVAVAVELAEQV
jgi:hypothetical protein